MRRWARCLRSRKLEVTNQTMIVDILSIPQHPRHALQQRSIGLTPRFSGGLNVSPAKRSSEIAERLRFCLGKWSDSRQPLSRAVHCLAILPDFREGKRERKQAAR